MRRTTSYPLIAALLFSQIIVSTQAQAAVPFSAFFSHPENTPAAAPDTSQGLPSLAPVLKQVTPAVVNISTKTKVRVAPNPLMDDPIFRQFFNFKGPNMPQEREVQSAGSGVIVDAEKGYILTNNHVVKEADEIYVTIKDKRRLKAELIGRDEETDIAVLKVKADKLTAIKMGVSHTLEVGDFVVAIGNPFGIGQTVTSGIVSALDRTGLGIEGYENFIQTDAAINPGNSGGALINLRGELVGINTAILSRSGGNVGIGFAIPVDMANQIMSQLVSKGSIERGQLGVHIQDVTPEITEAMGISTAEGALVSRVEKDSNAEKAGLKEGDVVVSFNGSPVKGAGDLRNRVGMLRVGEKVTMEVLRDNERVTITATIGKRTVVTAGAVESDAPLLKGATLGAISPDSPRYNKVKGVQILSVDPSSPAAAAGLQPGDIIASVNRKPVTTPAEALAAAKTNKKVLLLNVIRGNAALFMVIQ